MSDEINRYEAVQAEEKKQAQEQAAKTQKPNVPRQ